MPNATVLIVDDEELIRWSLRERLKTDGYRVERFRLATHSTGSGPATA